MQNQRQYLNRENRGVPNFIRLLLLHITIVTMPMSCMSCQQNKHAAPTSKHADSIHAKMPSETSSKKGLFHIDNTVTINGITNLPDINKIFVFKDGKKIQTITYKYDWDEYGFPTIGHDSIGKIDFVDVDFDGNNDILAYKGGFGNQGADIYDCFLWNDDESQFKIAPSFSHIQNPSIDTRLKCIYSFSRENAACYVHEKYKFQNGEFRVISTLKEKLNKDRIATYILETSKDGILQKKILHSTNLGEWKERVIGK